MNSSYEKKWRLRLRQHSGVRWLLSSQTSDPTGYHAVAVGCESNQIALFHRSERWVVVSWAVDVGAYVTNSSSFIFIWRWRLCTYIYVSLFQSLHNMFVVVVVDVVTYSFPVLGLTPPLSDPVRARRLVLTSCFLNLQVRQMRSAIISGGSGESIVYCVLLYSHRFLCHLSFIFRSSRIHRKFVWYCMLDISPLTPLALIWSGQLDWWRGVLSLTVVCNSFWFILQVISIQRWSVLVEKMLRGGDIRGLLLCCHFGLQQQQPQSVSPMSFLTLIPTMQF